MITETTSPSKMSTKEFIDPAKDASLFSVARNRDRSSDIEGSSRGFSSAQPCVSPREMNSPPNPPASNSMLHNSGTGSVVPLDTTTSRASASPFQSVQTFGFARWSHGEGNVRSATYPPRGVFGFTTTTITTSSSNTSSLLATRSGSPSLSYDRSATTFGGQTPRPLFSTTGVRPFENNGGMWSFAPATRSMLPLYPQPRAHASQDHTASSIFGVLGSSAVGEKDNPFKSGTGLDVVVDDDDDDDGDDDDDDDDIDVLAAAAAAAIEPPQKRKFGSLNVDDIDLNVAIFYFGVLSLVSSLRPNFSYERTAQGYWRAFLTYWGATVSRNGFFEDKFVAKAETCRAALERLKEKYSGWVLPELPGVQVVLGSWIWTSLLQEYCERNKLSRPTYTKYLHDDGFCYEVDVGGNSYFGANKFYKSATEAIHASAHAALYSLLLTFPEAVSLFRGVGFAGGLHVKSTNNEAATTRVQKSSIQTQGRLILFYLSITDKVRKRQAERNRVLSGDPGVSAGISNVTNSPRAIMLQPGSAKQGSRKSKKGKKKAKGGNANLFPIPTKNRRLPTIEALSSKTKSRRISSEDLELMTKQYQNPCERVEKMCSLLSMEQPEYQIDPLQAQEGVASLFSAAARFPNDPFLSRVGKIGRTKFVDSMQMAKEKCAAQVVVYLIKMVQEDEEWEDPEVKVEENIRKWEGIAATATATATA
ncbi:hypothetical protein AJ78_08328 [Emergomyces pasteurianus Ep9510]|uniref:Uncharacterized protein n=1 Tax=Emergomyces pasteurianus Ep9510 TaxID=1447872 RepID=A0A1J9Q6F8_9EURO|nr:hypothetical protein AJ78_08328 [Emergomyces pasteurianus Ep9510]